MPRIRLKVDAKTGEPVRKDLKTADEIKKGDYIVIQAFDNKKQEKATIEKESEK